MQQQSISNKLFTCEGTDDSGSPVYSPTPQVQQVCQVVDGFIYVANAEPGRGQIRGHFYFFFFFCLSATTTPHHAHWFLLNKTSAQTIFMKTNFLSRCGGVRGGSDSGCAEFCRGFSIPASAGAFLCLQRGTRSSQNNQPACCYQQKHGQVSHSLC